MWVELWPIRWFDLPSYLFLALLQTAAGGFIKTRSLWKVSIYSAMAHAEKQKAIIEREAGKGSFSSFGKAVLMDSR